jgi:hypothetical protein
VPEHGRRSRPDWAAWSKRRAIGWGLLYGLVAGGAVGVTQALIDGDRLRDAIENAAFDMALWGVFGAALLLLTRWGARHPRRR